MWQNPQTTQKRKVLSGLMVSGVPVHGRLLVGNSYCLCRNREASGTSWDLWAAHFLSHKEPPSATFWVFRNCSPGWKVSVPRKLLHCGREWPYTNLSPPYIHVHICMWTHPFPFLHTHSDTFQRQHPPKFSDQAPSLSSLLSHEYSSVDLSIKEVHTLVIQLPLTEPTGNRIFNTLREVFRFKLCHRWTSCILSLCFVIKHKSASSGPVLRPPCRHCKYSQFSNKLKFISLRKEHDTAQDDFNTKQAH